VLFRKSEKEILHFLKDCSKKFETVIDMDKESAFNEIRSWEDGYGYKKYFLETVRHLL